MRTCGGDLCLGVVTVESAVLGLVNLLARTQSE